MKIKPKNTRSEKSRLKIWILSFIGSGYEASMTEELNF